MQVGFFEKTATIRMIQYESDSKSPKTNLTQSIVNIFGISIVLNVLDITTALGSMHTLLALENIYDLNIDKINNEFFILLDKIEVLLTFLCLIVSPLGKKSRKIPQR